MFKQTTLFAAIASVISTNIAAQGEFSKTLEEITVTATARETSMQDIPYNISALTGEELQASGISNETDLMRALSGATVVDRGPRNSGIVNSIVVRGLNVGGGNEGDNALNAIATVSTYVDSTPMYAGFVLRDIQRVELLRGPQGTLYGSGALGGTVRFITNRPDPTQFGIETSLDYSQTAHSDGHNLNGDLMINIPLGEKAAFRAHAGIIDNDGVIDSVNAYRLNDTGEPLANVNGDCLDPRNISDSDVVNAPPCLYNNKDSDWLEITYGRASLLWEPADALSLQLSYQAQEEDTGGRRAITIGGNSARDLSGPEYSRVYGSHDNGTTAPEGSERNVDLLNLDISYNFGFATLTSNTARFTDEGEGRRDQSGLYADNVVGVDWLYLGSPRHYAITPSGYEQKTTVQEFRLVSNETKNNIDWLTGLFYVDEDRFAYNDTLHRGVNNFYESCLALGDGVDPTTMPLNCQTYWPAETQYLFGFPGVPLDENDYLYRRDADYQELAAYGELTYHLTETVNLTGGLRWFKNEQTTSALAGFPTCCGEPTPFPPRDGDDNGVLFKLNLAWDINESLMTYSTFSQGYRRGGVNAVLSPEQSPLFGEPGAENIQEFDRDTVDNYEVGLKGSYSSYIFSAALFYVDWTDPQFNLGGLATGVLYAGNGDAAHTKGFEADLKWLINENWNYRVAYTHLKGSLDGDLISAQDGMTVLAEDGESLPGTPENVLSMNLDGYWDLTSNRSIVSNIGAYWQDDQKNVIQSNGNYSETFDSFWMIGASLSYWLSQNWQFTLYGTNLLDEEGITSSQPSTAGTFDAGPIDNNWYGNRSFHYIAQPRTFGLRARYVY